MKNIIGVFFITSILTSGVSMAENELEKPIEPLVEQDTHLTWHQFRHELNNYTQIQAQMTHEGIVYLYGHVEDSTEKLRVERLAKRVRGAIMVRNQISTD